MSGSIGVRGGLGSFGGGTLGQVLVRVGVDTKQLDSGLAKAKTQSETAGTSIGKFGAIATAGFALAGLAAVKFAADAVKSYAEHERVLSQLHIAIEGSTTALEDQATALQNLTGYQDEEVLAADTVLARFKLTKTEIQNTIPLVLDYARATGQDAASAASNLGKAMLGNTRALKTIGVEFTATGNKAADLAAITDALKLKVEGAAAAFGQTAEGQLAIFSARLDDVKEELGKALIPILAKLLGVVQALLPALSLLVSNLGPIILAFATFAAFNFIPPLLLSIAVGLEALGASSLSNAILGAAAAVEAVGAAAAGAAVGVGLLAVAIANSHFDETLTAPLHEGVDALMQVKAATELAASTGMSYAEALKFIQDAVQQNTEETNVWTQAMQQAKAAMKALAGEATTLIGSILSLRAAQKDLHTAQKDSTTSADELRGKEIAVLEAFAGVKTNLSELLDKMKEGDATQQDVINKFDAQARAAGLSEKAIADLNRIIRQYIGSLNSIPTSVTTQLILTGDSASDTGFGGNGGGGGGNGGGGGGSPQQESRSTIHVHAGLHTEDTLIDVVHAGLIRKQRRNGSLQLT